MVDRAVPNLPSRDFAATVAFYGRLGFEEDYRDDGWLVLRRGTMRLEFFRYPDLDPFQSSFMCSIRVDDLPALVDAIGSSGVPRTVTGIPRLIPIAMQEWGQRAAFLIDLDGTQLHLIENTADDE